MVCERTAGGFTTCNDCLMDRNGYRILDYISQEAFSLDVLNSDEWRWMSRCGWEFVPWPKVNDSGAYIEYFGCKDRAAVYALGASMTTG